MGLRMKNFNMGVDWNIQLLEFGSQKKQYIGGLPKKGSLDSLQI